MYVGSYTAVAITPALQILFDDVTDIYYILLRFYHAKYTAASMGGLGCIVWHSLTATSKRSVDILVAEYSIFHFASDAIYLRAVWTKFAELLF